MKFLAASAGIALMAAAMASAAWARGAAPTTITIEDGIRSVAIAEACYRSSKAGGAFVPVPPSA